MGLLDQLWDETVAGPRPDHGIGKLRKYSSFTPSSSWAATAVTRSITIARPASSPSLSGDPSSVPSSRASAPDSPFAAATSSTERGDCWRAFRRKSKMADLDVRAEAAVVPRSPTVYDWVVISSLDR